MKVDKILVNKKEKLIETTIKCPHCKKDISVQIDFEQIEDSFYGQTEIEAECTNCYEDFDISNKKIHKIIDQLPKEKVEIIFDSFLDEEDSLDEEDTDDFNLEELYKKTKNPFLKIIIYILKFNLFILSKIWGLIGFILSFIIGFIIIAFLIAYRFGYI